MPSAVATFGNEVVLGGATSDEEGDGLIEVSTGGSAGTIWPVGRGPVTSLAVSAEGIWATALCAPAETCGEQLIVSRDGGQSWSAEKDDLTGVAIASDGTVLARDANVPRQAWQSPDGGLTWTSLVTPCAADWYDVGALVPNSDGALWIACTGNQAAGSQDRSVWSRSDANSQWLLRSAVSNVGNVPRTVGTMPSANPLGGIAAFSSTSGWLWTDRTLYLSKDSGVSWVSSLLADPDANRTIAAAAALSDGTGLALLRDASTMTVQLLDVAADGTPLRTIRIWPLSR